MSLNSGLGKDECVLVPSHESQSSQLPEDVKVHLQPAAHPFKSANQQEHVVSPSKIYKQRE